MSLECAWNCVKYLFSFKSSKTKNTFEFYIKTRWCHCRIRFNSHLYSSNVERTENRWMRKVTHLIDKPFHYIFLWFYILQNAFLILFIHGNRARCVGMAVNAFLHACYTCESSNYSVYLADSKVTHCECSVCRAGVFSLLFSFAGVNNKRSNRNYPAISSGHPQYSIVSV